HTPITAVEYGDRPLLSHPHGSILAARLVLANNAFGMSFGFLQGRMLPIFPSASRTRPLEAAAQARLGGRPYWGLIPADPYGTTVR
ncbi:hypothetical protein KQ757_15435, partial [Listeria monocytogenes]|nr:hypothetical protein [Listeria monocytogenes]